VRCFKTIEPVLNRRLKRRLRYIVERGLELVKGEKVGHLWDEQPMHGVQNQVRFKLYDTK